MDWEKVYLKQTALWLLVLCSAVAFLYFDNAAWAIIIFLSYISYQLIVVIMILYLLIQKKL